MTLARPWNFGFFWKSEFFFLKKIPNFFFCFGEGGRYRYSSIRSFALTLSTPMNRVNKNFEKNDWCAFNIINHPSKYQTRNLNEYHFRPLLLVKNQILPYGHENLRAFFSRFYLGSTYQIDTKVVSLWLLHLILAKTKVWNIQAGQGGDPKVDIFRNLPKWDFLPSISD